MDLLPSSVGNGLASAMRRSSAAVRSMTVYSRPKSAAMRVSSAAAVVSPPKTTLPLRT